MTEFYFYLVRGREEILCSGPTRQAVKQLVVGAEKRPWWFLWIIGYRIKMRAYNGWGK